jgi:folate-binding protein YgfZ
MLHESPTTPRRVSDDITHIVYGPDDAPTRVVESFGDLDMEYAALRKGCVLFDAPHLGTLRITGSERLAFLNNMLTAKTGDLTPGTSIGSFWLNRQGRIDADLRLIEQDDAMIVRLDRHLSKASAGSLGAYVFAEDVEITDTSEATHWISLHGPTAPKVIEHVAENGFTPPEPNTNTTVRIAGTDVVLDRDDLTGEIGYWIGVPIEHAPKVHGAILDAGDADPSLRLRETGWLAINTARIEAGNPLFNIDFGPENLPAESGIMDRRVHLAKGCYLGQEVVARMHARGIRKQGVVALRLDEQRVTMEQQQVLQPFAGAHVHVRGQDTETPVGAVTSSTISPMLGAIPICFAMLKDAHTAPGTELSVQAEGKHAPCVVAASLRFWSHASA